MTRPSPRVDETGRELFRRCLGAICVAGGGVGLIAAFVLLVERFRLADNPFYVPSCSLNPTVNCTTVMTSSQSSVFGFPNPMLGLVGFTIVITVGVVMLVGAVLPRWFWLGLQTGVTAGVVFVHWLIVETVVDIGALCPYCVAVWIVTILVFWYTTVSNVATGRLPLPKVLRAAGRVLVEVHVVVVTVWYAAIAGAVAARFWADEVHL